MKQSTEASPQIYYTQFNNELDLFQKGVKTILPFQVYPPTPLSNWPHACFQGPALPSDTQKVGY